MNRTMKKCATLPMAALALLMALLTAAPLVQVRAQAQAPAQAASSRFVGAIAAINGSTLTVKTDAGEVHQVDVPATAALRRIAPGQKDLSTAETIQFSDLAVGDRVLVRVDPDTPGPPQQALQIIAVKQSDLAAKQQKDREDWQRRGVGGLVKSVDASTGVILLTSGAGATAKTITVNTTKATLLKRYAPASVKYDDAKPAPIDAIHAGDQVRARGTKNADGTQIAAEEVVSGSFRNISGTVTSVDAASSTLVVKDLATKKQVTVHFTPDVQMKRLPDRMAQMLAARLKGGAAGSGGGGGWNGNSQAPTSPSAGTQRGGTGQYSGGGGGGQAGSGGGQWGGQGAGSGQGGGQWAGQGGAGGGGGDMQQMLSRAPTIQLSDLQKGEAVMLVSTEGSTDVTAITLLAGVEPLLEAPAARDLLSNWSMGSGGAEAAAAQ
jgi:hypothetical protein